MGNAFDEQLNKLHNEMIGMGKLCTTAIENAVNALWSHDDELAHKTIDLENEINQKERDIERLCFKLLLKQQPVAKDLRHISAVLKMITDLERIGDQAAEISEIVLKLDRAGSSYKSGEISHMAQVVIDMVAESVAAYVDSDVEKAQEVIDHDDIVDDDFVKIREALVVQIREDSSFSADALDYLMIAKYLERIGDHSVNVSVWVKFSVTGRF